ncbi:MAG: hypothetical protein IKI75_09975, partial [Lachnospiraceae bacterium]|nr:hypothetical protein [Lachnospiraceae bacterium]
EEEEKEEKKPKNLEEVMESLTKGKKGQGRFNKLILKNYFRDSSMMDKRAMMASMVRSVKPKQAYVMSDEEAVKAVRKKWGKTYCKDPDNLTDFDRKIMEVFKKDYAQIESSGSILGGMLKGAGPLLQKVMQGMPMEGVPDSLKMAIKDMKSNLLPIPEDYVKSVMNVIIDRSNGGIKKIEVERSLGAASVGQAFLCKIYGRKFKNGKEVVIKILRPDAKNHMEREKVLMRGYAQQTDKSGGMLETFEGQLAGYEKELDLTLESRNVDAGKIYEGQEKEVVSMGIDHTVEAGPGYMLAEKAEGITVDRYLEDIDKKIEQIRRQFFKSLGEGKGNEMTLDKKNSALLLKSNEELLKEIKRLEKRRDNVCKLCGIWVKEGMIKSGFYHADLHSGNMMITDEKVTVIDYGNAVQINEHQQKWISAMLAAASTGDVELFFQSFDSLLDGKEEEKFRAFYNDEKKRQLKEAFRDVLRMGDVTETGQRIMACFLKAQELGVKVPPAVYNFSQGQLRLMNTVDEMNGKIQSLKDTIRELGTMKNAGISANDSVNPLLLSAKKRDLAISQDLSRNGKDLIDQQIAELEGKTKEQLFKKMKDVDAKKKGALARFRNSIAADEVNVSVALDPAKATTFKPKAAAAFIRDGIKRIKEKYNINDEDCIDRKYEEKISYEQRLEEGKALIEQVLPLVSTAPSHIVLKAYMKGYYAQMWQDVANCRFEKMDEYIRYFEERLPLVFEVGAKLKEWEKAKEDGRSAKTLRRLEREFCDKYYQLKDMSEGDTTIFADVRKQMELDEEDPEEFRKEDEERRAELQGMFEDETDGEQLRAAYDKLRETQKALIRGEEQRDDIIMEEDDDAVVIDKKKTKADLEADKDKAMDGFMELYKKVGIRQLKRQRDLLYDENTTKVKSNSFLHVMGRVLSDPMLLVKTAWRVGGSVGWKIYRSESHAKSQLKLERELKRQKEEAEKRKQEEEREKAGEGKAKDDVKLPDPDDREYTDLAEKAYNLLIKYYEKLNRNVPNFFPQDELESVMKQILRAEKDKKRKKPFGVDDIILEQQEKKEDPNADLPEEDSDEWDKLLLRASELLKDYYLKKTGVEPIGVKHDECVQVMRQIAKAKKENRLFTTNDIVLEKQDEQEEKKEDVKEDLIKNEDEKEDIKEEDKKEEEKEDKKEEKKDKKARKKKGYYADMTDEEKEYHELWREAYDMIQKRLFSASEYRNPSDDEVKIQIDILKAEREKNKK